MAKLFAVPLGREKKSLLRSLAVSLGADVPFFMQSAPFCLGTGIGDRLKPIQVGKSLPYMVLAYPSLHVATPDVYRALVKPSRAVVLTRLSHLDRLIRSLERGRPVEEWEGLLFNRLEEAGLPPGVINFLPGSGREIGNAALSHRDFSGVHFTGSTAVFNGIWKTIADNLSRGIYKSYPRIVGETGGKNFVFAAPDADARALSVALFRGAFEYQGQKCSAASRAYIPRSLWPEVKNNLIQMTAEAKTGDVSDLDTFMGAVIDRSAFESITGYIRRARETASSRVIAGGESDPSRGWFIQPTVIETDDPVGETMKEEIFGPVLTVFPYEEKRIDETLALADSTSPYALTGAVFSGDRRFIEKASNALRHAAGNFYINDKPTGAVVGQQPFGGARMSGTNDKSGSPLNLLRWVSARTIKENLNPPADWRYPHQKGK